MYWKALFLDLEPRLPRMPLNHEVGMPFHKVAKHLTGACER